MEVVKVSRDNMEEVLRKAIDVLQRGGVVAFPTETFYGLGVRYDNEDALRRLYEVKKRPMEKAIPLLVKDIHQVETIVEEIPPLARQLMERYWPGPLTIVLRARPEVSPLLTAGTGKVAVRVPGESFALELVRAAGFPITATSANPSGAPPATTAQEVLKYFTVELDLIVDGGKSLSEEPSTIVEIVQEGVKLLRRGVVKRIAEEGQ